MLGGRVDTAAIVRSRDLRLRGALDAIDDSKGREPRASSRPPTGVTCT